MCPPLSVNMVELSKFKILSCRKDRTYFINSRSPGHVHERWSGTDTCMEEGMRKLCTNDNLASNSTSLNYTTETRQTDDLSVQKHVKSSRKIHLGILDIPQHSGFLC